MLPCSTSAGWVNATARAVGDEPMSRVSGINRPAQVSLRPWDFDLGNPGAVSTQYLVFGSSEGEASRWRPISSPTPILVCHKDINIKKAAFQVAN
ncbi:hypothetical protein FPOA_10195 [Fusarium poae]|uniref:Uncharacterized protein n=1 Tax=Fusarium poae TaxID=36050 RepID=A0A1B8ADC2_FUSPO|nr:hypothetical protein FPOA_10195 [Fusarium poae]